MKTAQRQRHKDQVRRSILSVASQIIENEGYPGVTIRRIAQAINYSIPTIYEHFDNKEAILNELQREWSRKMLEIIQEIHAKDYASDVALEKCALEYAQYALASPAFYKAVMGMEGIPCSEGIGYVEIHTIRTILKEWIQNAIGKSRTKPLDLDNTVDIFRGFLHGVVSLYLIQKLKGDEKRLHNLLRQGVHEFLYAWKKG